MVEILETKEAHKERKLELEPVLKPGKEKEIDESLFFAHLFASFLFLYLYLDSLWLLLYVVAAAAAAATADAAAFLEIMYNEN